jgi:hypothetical protein
VPVLQQKWLALLSRLSYVGILETLALPLRPLALSIDGVPRRRRFNDAGWLEPF